MSKFILNDVELETVVYPNGEIDIKTSSESIKSISEKNIPSRLEWYDCQFQDILVLGKISRYACDGVGALYVDIFPYQRSDRDFFNNCNDDDGVRALVDRVFRYIKHVLHYKTKLLINDPHCEYLTKQDNVEVVYSCVYKIVEHTQNPNNQVFDAIVFPDKNAANKYKNYFSSTPILILHKERDVQTGKIISHELVNREAFPSPEKDLYLGSICIVDDICDRGGTFVSAKEILEANGVHANNWYLSVSHNTKCEKDPRLLGDFNLL